ncbi:MAG: nuclear transport factor 2 family protein [Nocardioidaceae bacterium]
MTLADAAADVLRGLWTRIDEQRWGDLDEVLDPTLRVEYVHTGEVFDRAAYIRLNREYPGSWRAHVAETVSSGERAVSRVRVSDGFETYHVASFATVRDARIVNLVEVWSSSGETPPTDRRQADNA